MNLRDESTMECPVSLLTVDDRGRSAELLTKWYEAQRRGVTLSALLGMKDDALIADAEDAFNLAKLDREEAWSKERNR